MHSGANPWPSSNAQIPQSQGAAKKQEPPSGKLAVEVREQTVESKLLAKIKVEIKGPGPSGKKQSKSTGRDGVARFESLDAGSYTITASHDDYVTATGQANVSSPGSTESKLKVRPARQLFVQLYEHRGSSSPSVLYELWAGGKRVASGDSFTGAVKIPFTDDQGKVVIDEALQRAHLLLQIKRRGVKHGRPQKILLHFDQELELKGAAGGVDPAALQRILTNLGYAPGAVDGKFHEGTQAALRAFQADHELPVSGIPDKDTIAKLVKDCGNPISSAVKAAAAGDPVFPGGKDPDFAPALGADAQLKLDSDQWYEKGSMWDQYEGYIERAAPHFPAPQEHQKPTAAQFRVEKGDETGLRLFDVTRGAKPEDAAFGGVPDESRQRQRFFPTEAYVRIGTKGDTSWKNSVRMLKYRAAFVDCGGWLGEQRDFALVHGWHAYLCEYVPSEARSGRALKVAPKSGAPRPDHEFFSAMGNAVKVKSVISAVWGLKREFDWRNVTVVFPDLHMMTAIAGNCWKHNDRDDDGPFYDLGAEIDLFDFARLITANAELRSHVKVIQVGDAYDLWVGSAAVLGHDDPLFEENTTSLMKLRPASAIPLPSGHTYRDRAGIEELLTRWGSCPGVRTAPPPADLRTQVLQWWIEAIQGLHDSPLEIELALHKDLKTPWVQWILRRRSKSTNKDLAAVAEKRAAYAASQLKGSEVAKWIKANYPDAYAKLPDQPTISPVGYVGFEPERGRVLGWLDSMVGPLEKYEARSAAYQTYAEKELKQWLNPGEAALRLLKAKCAGIQYIYGNHDNYLIDPAVSGGTCDGRVRFIEAGGCFYEHAHRLEPLLAVGSANYDGCLGGFGLTNNVWRDKFLDVYPKPPATFFRGWKKLPDFAAVSERAGRARDAAVRKMEFMDPAVVPASQMTYKNEGGRFMVGRYAAGGVMPRMLVIGHTHAPAMQLKFVHLNDGTDIKGPGNLHN